MNNGPMLPHQRQILEREEMMETYVNPIERIGCKIDDFFGFPGRVKERIKGIIYNFAIRNSIQTPLPNELSFSLKGKEVSYKVSSVLMGKHERIDVGLGPLNGYNTFVDAIIGEKDDIRNFKSIGKNGIPSYSTSLTKGKNKVYSGGIGLNEVSFVKLKDKGAYIEQKKRDLFDELKQYTISNLMYSRELTINDNTVLFEINDLYNMGYISTAEIEKIINIWLRNKTDSIFGKIGKNDINLDSLDILIIGWGILNGAFIEYIIKELEKTTGNSRDFFTRNIVNINYEELIFNLIIKQS